MEGVWVKGQGGFQDGLNFTTENTPVSTRHSDVALKGRSVGQDLLVGGGHMRVGTEHGTDSAIEKVPHRLLVAGGFGMQVYATDADLGRDLFEDLFDGFKGAIDRAHEHAS